VLKTTTIAFLFVVAQSAHAQATCRLEGVWQLVSGKADGQPYAASARSIKIITKGHFAVLGDEARGVKELKTAADSVQAFRTMTAGGGTYKLQGTTYTETLDYFGDPAYTGRSVSFTCRTEGDRFFQTGSYPVFENGKKVRDIKLDEVWRRIE
jgi:hypothetical protein